MDDWTASNIKHRDFQHSDRLEDWEETKHRRKASRGKDRLKCKGKGAHVYKVIKFYHWEKTWFVLECIKCHKHKWTVTPP